MKKLILILLIPCASYSQDISYSKTIDIPVSMSSGPDIQASSERVDLINRVSNQPVRQTILHAKTNTDGYADFISYSGLTATVQGANTKMVVTLADGFNESGQVDYIATLSRDIKIGLPINTTAYLYLEYNKNNASFDLNYITTAPTYGYALPSGSTGEFAFSIPDKRMYSYGTSWQPQLAIFIAEAVTNGTEIISAKSYAINSEYDSGYFAITSNTGYAKAHNIGAIPTSISLLAATSDAGENLGQTEGDTGMADTAAKGMGYGSITTTSVSVRTTNLLSTVSLWTNAALGLIPTHARILVRRGW